DLEVVRLGALPVGVQIHAILGREDIPGGLRVGLASTTGQAGYARGQDHEGHEVPADEGQFRDSPFRYVPRDLGLAGLDQWNVTGDCHLCRGRADFHLDVEVLGLVVLEQDALEDRRIEARRRRANRELTWWQRGDAVISDVGAADHALNPRGLILDDNF